MDKQKICSLIVQRINDSLSSPDFLDAYRDENHFIRKRKLSMHHLITYLFYTSKASMSQNLASIREELPSVQFPSVSKQAVSKARQFISPLLFRDLFNLAVDTFYKEIDDRKSWHGYHVFAVDGSKIEIPNSPSNFEFFGEMFTYPHKERKFTSGLASIIYDVLDDFIVHASLHRYLASERAAAKQHLMILDGLDIYSDSIIIFDRGYFSEEMFRYCVSHGYLCLMRLQEQVHLSRSCHGEIITTLRGNPRLHTEDISVRVIEVILDDGSKEYLATNLFDSSISAEMFRELYFLRWPVETKYLELKERFCLEEYSGKTKTAVFQDFFINLLLSNLVSLIKNKVDDDIDRSLTSASRHRYQANRSFIIGRFKKIFPRILCGDADLSAIDLLVSAAFNIRSQIQPGRSFRRKNSRLICRRHFPNKKRSF